MNLRVPRRLVVLLASVALLASACSSGEATSGDGVSSPEPAAPTELAVAVASYDLAVGDYQRFIAGVLTPERGLIGFGEVDLQFARLGEDGDADPIPGPETVGRWLPVPGIAPTGDTGQPTLIDQPGAAGVYQTWVDFDQPGFWTVEVTAQVDGQQLTGSGTFRVGTENEVPALGEMAPASDSLTVDSPGPAGGIDSRAGGDVEIPDPVLHATSIADAIAAGRPAVVVFSTPVYCVSRFCGPITDTVEELASTHGDRAEFIHVEVWKDFEEAELNDAAADWIQTEAGGNEPWVFLIGADGRVAARWDNVLDLDELVELLDALPTTE